MHGMIFAQLKKYVEKNYSLSAWNQLVQSAGGGPKIYLTLDEYPDQELMAIVTTASKVTGKAIPALLEDFGAFMVPDLVSMYRPLISPKWRTLDLIENTEGTIHKVVRARQPGAKPPALEVKRVSPTEVVLRYASPRKLCAVARGIARGVADHYGEKVQITESQCMHQGARECMISIRSA